FCARVIANSRATAAAFVANGGRPDRVRVVLNGIDPAPFQRLAAEEIDALRGQLGVAGVPTVGVFSRLAPWKGQHVLLEALSQLPGAHALLVGEALFGEQDYANTLRELAVKLGIADRVHFLGFRQDIPQLMSLVDVVAHTSVTPEPFGRVLVEGMLARRPVVAARAGGVLEIVEDGVTGLLVAPGDARGLASVLRDLFADPNKARALAEAGYATAIQRFSVEALLRGVTEQVSEVLALSRRG
ncbi:MAG: glycosyltransferase family 4 protein, partial [Verrucomicrobia bacterium]|nr:glycosyltransferase family 4 protein [Verrucomicrobiota bacterium]